MDNKIRLLKECIEKRNPILLLGAGFSADAYNSKKERMPLGSNLAKDLYRTVIEPVEKKLNLDEEEKSELNYAVTKGKLKEVCNQIRAFRLLDERNDYFTKRMTVHSYDNYYKKLLLCDWSYIFTLNIDDLVEKIYHDEKKSFSIWTSSNKSYKEENGKTILIKLHGDVADKTTYIFDDNEYRSYSSINNIMLTKFAGLYVNHDVIIIGTQFQEEDVEIALNDIFHYGCDNSAFNYFFISPNDFNRKLSNEIDSRPNFYHIRWKTNDFLRFLEEKVTEPRDSKNSLISCGVIDWNEALTKCGFSSPDTGIYLGEEVKASDFLNNRDITHNDKNNVFYEYNKNHNSGLIIIHGESFVGKTCLAKRYLTEYYKIGYQTFYSSRIDERLIYSIEKYLKRIDEDAKVALCLENAGAVYKSVSRMVNRYKDKIHGLFVITTSNEISHNPQSYMFSGVDHLDVLITEAINRQLSINIYNTLSENSYLGKLQSYGNENDIIKHIRSVNDIIDVLYEANQGKQFSEYFENWIATRRDSDYLPMFNGVVLLASIGMNYCSISILPYISISMGMRKFEYSRFQNVFGAYCIEDNGYLYIRCTRLFGDIIISNIDKNTKMKLVTDLAHILSYQVKECENTEVSDILEKVLKTRSLHDVFGLNYNDISNIFDSVKEDCKHLSYYWIQRGIAYRNCSEYERAGNAFEYAESTRGKLTYQIAHAKAKNLMEWGLSNQFKSTRSYALFEEGTKQMLGLVYNWDYPEAKCFSIHAYIDMNLKYYSSKKITIPFETWKAMVMCFETYLNNAPFRDKLIGCIFHRMVLFAREKSLCIADEDSFRLRLKSKGQLYDGKEYTIDIDQLSIV